MTEWFSSIVSPKGVSVQLPDSTEGNPVNPCYDRIEAGVPT